MWRVQKPAPGHTAGGRASLAVPAAWAGGRRAWDSSRTLCPARSQRRGSGLCLPSLLPELVFTVVQTTY